jgi:peroxiredoxin
LAEYGRVYEAIRAAGANFVALSVDPQARSEALRTQLALPYPILCDPARVVVRAWDLYNPRELGGIAVPALFVLGTDRRVRYRSIDSTRERVATDGVLRFLNGETQADVLGRARVRAGLGEFARAIANAVRRGLR